MAGEPVRVKAYGLRYFTKAGYLKLQVVVFAVFGLLLIFAFLWEPKGFWATNPIFANSRWFVLLFMALELGETVVMLRKFQNKERALASSRPYKPR
jgi:hypothetical protein